MMLLLGMKTDSRSCYPSAAMPDPAAVVLSPNALAESLYWRGEDDSARTLWRGGLPAARSAGDGASQAHLLTWQGLAAWRLGDYAEARRSGEAALALKLRLGLTRDLFKSYNALGLLAWNQGRLLDAVQLLRAASASAAAAGDPDGTAKAAGNLALVQAELGEFDAARSGFATMLDAGRQASDLRVQGNALTNLAMLDVRVGDPDAAIQRLRGARDLYRSIDYVTGEISALGQLGVAYQEKGEFQAALSVLDSALLLARRRGLRQEEASNLETLAQLHQETGDWHRALDLYSDAQKVNAELGLRVEEGTDLRLEAEIHRNLGELQVGLSKASAALGLHRSTGAHVEELHDRILLAELASGAGDQAKSPEQLKQARILARRIGTRISRAEVVIATARSLQEAGRSRSALQLLRNARADLETGGYDVELQVQELRSAAFKRLHQLDSAETTATLVVQTVERLRGNIGSGTLRAAYLASKNKAYATLIGILLQQKKVDRAFEAADASRGRALLEHLAATPYRQGPNSTVEALRSAEGLLRRGNALVAELAELESDLSHQDDSTHQAMRRYLTSKIRETRNSFETIMAHAAGRDPPVVQLLGAGQVSLKTIQSELRKDEALVEYFVGPDSAFLFLVTASECRPYLIAAKPTDLLSRIRLARELLAQTAGSRTGPVLNALHDLLIKPLLGQEQLAGVGRLLIVPHGALVYLPFGALHNPETGRYLAEDFSVMSLPSAAALSTLRSKRTEQQPDPQRQAAAFAPFPMALPGSRLEAMAFVRSLADAKSHIGAEATEGSVRKALRGTAVIHLATHGRMNPVNPMFSRLELAAGRPDRLTDDGQLEVHELLDLTVHSALVFLSGCETGTGAAWSNGYEVGEDYATLAQAFLYAGAGNVISTLWRIQDAGAAAFTERFYRHLQQAAAPEALALAQRDLLRQPRYSSPYYWAAYQVVGRGELLRTAQK